MKKKILPLICFALAIITTATVYILFVDGLFQSPIKWLSLTFVLLAEISLLAKTVFGKKAIILNSQIFAGIAYLAVVAILSIIYINATDPKIKPFIAIHLILLFLLTALDLSILYAQKRTDESDAKLATNQSIFSDLCALCDNMIVETNSDALKKELSSLSESLRFSDNSSLTGGEAEITLKLEDLKQKIASSEATEEDALLSNVKEINDLLRIRNNNIKQIKRGSF